VRFAGVTKRFGRTVAVDELTLEIEDGEFLVLVGPSGCGKSTALRMIAGLEEISEGDLYIGSRRVNDLAPKDRDVAMVFQSYALYPHMSVYDNLAFALQLRHVPRSEIGARVRDAAAILGIANLLDRKPKQLSGGQRQRVALGRAIVREPQVFLMDEPLSNLDAKLRVEMRAEIGKLHQRLGVTTVYVTHDQVEAMTMGDRIAVLRDGLLQQVDAPMTLYDSPANVFVATFIGSPSMNILRARVGGSSDGVFLETDGFRLPAPAPRAPELVERVGQELLLGIRPEHLETRELAENVDATIQAGVEVAEPMGSEIVLHLRAGQDTVTARVDPRTRVAPGDVVELAVDLERIHLFDPDTEEAILGRPTDAQMPPVDEAAPAVVLG
jgi:multiple sugar transport system ATP-binding protein